MPIIKKEEVIDNWSVLISGGQGKAEEIFSNTSSFIQRTNVPNVKVERKKMAPGIMRGLVGEKREFLVVTETRNRRLKPYQMFVNARDYGDNLDVSWYLTYRIPFWQKAILFFLSIPGLNFILLPFAFMRGLTGMAKEGRFTMDLDLFDWQDLTAYVTNAHHCLIEAVEKLMLEMGQDPSKIDRKSRGFLGIS